MDSMPPEDRVKLNKLYVDINNIQMPKCTHRHGIEVSIKVEQGLEIIKKSLIEIGTITK